MVSAVFNNVVHGTTAFGFLNCWATMVCVCLDNGKASGISGHPAESLLGFRVW
jgi:hypothetical protein